MSIEEIATDRLVDVVGEGFDIALRGHIDPLPDSNLVQRSIASVPWCLFAGAAYLERVGQPRRAEDLASHAILSVVRSGPLHWRLCGPDNEQVVVPIEPRFQSNNMVTLKLAACANLGVVALPGYICREELRAGTLRQVLPGRFAADAKISALIPYRRACSRQYGRWSTSLLPSCPR